MAIGSGLLLFFSFLSFTFLLCFTVVRSVPDSQCYYGVNGRHPENVGKGSVSSAENGTLGPERLSARRFISQLQSFKHFK